MNSINDIWQMVLQRLKQEKDMSETTINTFFDEVEAYSMQDRTFCLYCPNDFKRGTIESLFTDKIKSALRDIFSADFELKLLSSAEKAALENGAPSKAVPLMESGDFTFDTFVVGESNKMAYAAAQAVADGVGSHYNPLFIYGDSGLGKTHLIYAIAHRFRERVPDAKIVYVKGDDFINEFIELIRAGRGSEFRAKYRDANLLLVDDVQFVAGKEQVQNEFFHTFNSLYEAGYQIVLTSDQLPGEMTLLDDRLRTRFEWGLQVDVQAPDYETRVAIVKNKAARLGFAISDGLANYIAENVTANVRQLEGTVNKLKAYRDLSGTGSDDEETAERAMKDIVRRDNEFIPTPDFILKEVARCFNLDEAVVRGPSRSREVSNARQVAMYLVRRMTNLSTPDIGRAFGGRDHTTVLHALESMEAKLKTDQLLAKTVRDITVNINSHR